MDQLQHLATAFTPLPGDSLAFSALPDAPVLPAVERRALRRHVRSAWVRLLGARHGPRVVRSRPVPMPTTCSH